MIAPMDGQFLKSGQSPQVDAPFFKAHWRMLQRFWQNTVFIPLARHPSQLICSGKMGALFSFAHSFAVFSRRAWSPWIVARYASHFSQSSPQYPIISFMESMPPNCLLISAINGIKNRNEQNSFRHGVAKRIWTSGLPLRSSLRNVVASGSIILTVAFNSGNTGKSLCSFWKLINWPILKFTLKCEQTVSRTEQISLKKSTRYINKFYIIYHKKKRYSY